MSFLIRKSPDQRSFASFPELIAGYHVLLRFSMPRHPPYTLKSLTTFIDHRHPPPPGLRSQVVTDPQGVRNGCNSNGRCAINNGSLSPKRCSTTSARQKDQSSGGGSTLAGADIAEVSSFQMNLLLNLKNHSLVKERPPPDSVGSSPRGRSTGFPAERG